MFLLKISMKKQKQKKLQKGLDAAEQRFGWLRGMAEESYRGVGCRRPLPPFEGLELACVCSVRRA